MAAKLDSIETMKEELVGIARAGWQVESKTIKTGYGSVCHDCSTDNVMKGQSK